MNKERKAATKEIMNKIEALRNDIDDLRDELRELEDEERDYYENMPEGIQEGEDDETATEHLENYKCADGELWDACSSFDKAIDFLGEIAGH